MILRKLTFPNITRRCLSPPQCAAPRRSVYTASPEYEEAVLCRSAVSLESGRQFSEGGEGADRLQWHVSSLPGPVGDTSPPPSGRVQTPGQLSVSSRAAVGVAGQ